MTKKITKAQKISLFVIQDRLICKLEDTTQHFGVGIQLTYTHGYDLSLAAGRGEKPCG